MRVCFRPKAAAWTALIQDSIALLLKVDGSENQISCRNSIGRTFIGAYIGYQMLLSYAGLGLWKVSI